MPARRKRVSEAVLAPVSAAIDSIAADDAAPRTKRQIEHISSLGHDAVARAFQQDADDQGHPHRLNERRNELIGAIGRRSPAEEERRQHRPPPRRERPDRGPCVMASAMPGWYRNCGAELVHDGESRGRAREFCGPACRQQFHRRARLRQELIREVALEQEQADLLLSGYRVTPRPGRRAANRDSGTSRSAAGSW